MISWMESDRIKLKHMLEDYQKRGAKSFMSRIAEKLANDISNFEKKINVKSDGDLGIAKACSEFKKLNKRFVSRAVELLTRPLITEMETALKNLRTEKAETSEIKTSEVEVPSFGTTPNEFVTAAGVALLSLAHQLSAYSHDSNMAASLASASKIDTVDDVTSWWVEKCAAAVQDCFIDGIGEVRELPVPFARQFAVDYAYLADVFEDLGTPRIAEFIEMRKTFMDLGYISA